MAKAEAGLTGLGIDEGIATRLVGIGLISAEAFEGVTASDLEDAGFSEEEANGVLDKVTAFNTSKD